MIGKTLGRFEIVAPLGTGGMASVWRARDPLLNRDVAVKILDSRFASSESARKRFQNEGKIAALMSHPGISTVFGAGERDGWTYLVMELVEGTTVSEMAAQKLMPLSQALEIGISAASALGYAHTRGVVHRDVTSRNIMVRKDGSVVLLDFGIALAYGVSRVTSTGHMLGTPAYMAPESLRGMAADPRTDIYGLGVVLYEALTGALPFQGDRAEVVRFRALNEASPAPSTLRSDVPSDVDALVMKAMAREAKERYSDTEELERELRTLLAARPVHSDGRDSSASSAPPPHTPTASTATASTISDLGTRFSAGKQPVYLLVLPVEDASADAEPSRRSTLADLADAARAGLADIDRVRIVALPATASEENLAELARQSGANLVLLSKARSSGPTVRITFRVVEPATGTTFAGGMAQGSVLDPFTLEERFVGAVRSSMGRAFTDREPRVRPADPAAGSRLAQAVSDLVRLDREASVDGAVSMLEGLAQSDGDNAEIMAALTRAYLAKQELTRERSWASRAAEACDRAVAANPEAPATHLARAEMKLWSGHPHEALRDADAALEKEPDVYEALLVKSRALDQMGEVQEATRVCQSALASHPRDWRGYHTLGLQLLRRGQYVEALAPLREVTLLTPDNAAGYRNLGNAYFYLDSFEEARAAWEQSIDIRPSAMTYYNLGTLLFFQKQHAECLEMFEKAVALNTHDAHAWGNLGAACRSIAGQEHRMQEALEQAISIMRAELRQDPSRPESWGLLAGWYSNLDRHEEAVECAREALQRGPGIVDCMVRAAHVYLHAGDRDVALHWLEEAVANGHGIETLDRDEELEELRGDPRFKKLLSSNRKTVDTQDKTA